MKEVKFLQAGEQGLVVEFGEVIDAEINVQVHRLAELLVQEKDEAILETVSTYRSLLIYFDPLKICRKDLEDKIMKLTAREQDTLTTPADARVVHIPVCYGGGFGPDLEFVAQHNGISVDDVVRIHTSTPYLVYMLGFTPGFPYLGGMSPEIAAPRLEKPRTKIPAGSVGIAGSQTGFYPIESPGGWRLIGRTPVEAYNPSLSSPFLFMAGDYLKFDAVSMDEYEQIKLEVESGCFTPNIRYLKPKGGES